MSINEQEIDSLLSGERDEVLEVCQEIAETQSGAVPTIKTGIPHLDNFLVTGVNNQMIFIGARPSQGKTHMASAIKRNMLSTEVNPNIPLNILNLSWEMQLKSIILREMKNATGKGIKHILNNPLSEDDALKAKYAIAGLRDNRLTTFSHVVQGNMFAYLVEKMLEKNPGQELIIVLDHIHILLTKKEIDEFLSLCNSLKLKHKNLSFIIFFQLNREIEKAWRGDNNAKIKTNPKNYVPNSSHIYNTDTLYQFADVIMTMVIPQVVDLDAYAPVHKERNPHLSEHFLPSSDDSKFTQLKGRNRIFYNYIKIRLNDDFDTPRMYCDILKRDSEEMVTEQYYSEESIQKFEAPKFDKNKNKKVAIPEVAVPIVHNTEAIQNAKGTGFETEGKDDTPF